MRASRLLSILMHLQKGRVTAEYLSELLEVSVRTIYRDMDQLSLAGVPVYADRGRAGGFKLLNGWKMLPTGLTGLETEALLLSGMPNQVKQLGLQAAMLSGQNKLLETLSEAQRELIGKISAHVYVDPVSWFGKEEPADKLQVIADAVWNSWRIDVVYESWKGTVERTINPLGLVVKGGSWYLAGEAEGSERIYRVAKFKEVRILNEAFLKSPDFDLADFWHRSVERYEKDIYRSTAQLRVTEEGLQRMPELGTPVAVAAQESVSGPDAEGNFLISIPIETISQACSDILRLGTDCRVVAPPELVSEIRQALCDIARLYEENSSL